MNTWSYSTPILRRVVRMDDGESLVAYCDDGTVWEYNHTADRWDDRGIRPIPQAGAFVGTAHAQQP